MHQHYQSNQWLDNNYSGTIIGVDEVNFSPSICGDCMVCACIMPESPLVEGINDSKQLTKKKIKYLFGKIREVGAFYCVVPANLTAIDFVGIHDARAWAMDLAIKGALDFLILTDLARYTQGVTVLIDGTSTKHMHLRPSNDDSCVKYETLIRGDEKVYAIAAASIIARAYMDFLFDGYGKQWPEYGMERDHGTPSRKHTDALRKVGPSPVHRTKNYGKKWWERILGRNTDKMKNKATDFTGIISPKAIGIIARALDNMQPTIDINPEMVNTTRSEVLHLIEQLCLEYDGSLDLVPTRFIAKGLRNTSGGYSGNVRSEMEHLGYLLEELSNVKKRENK